MEHLIELLHVGHHSLVVSNGKIETFDGSGVADLFRLLNEDPAFLHGADVADKVVGKGAAALMILGKIHAVHADVISEPALKLFSHSSVEVSYDKIVPNIINRKGDGICPVETLCMPCGTAEECLPRIAQFIGDMRKNANTGGQNTNPTALAHRKTGKLRLWLYVLAAVVCVGIGVGIWAASVALDTYDGPDTRIYIPRGSTTESITDTLAAHLGQSYASSVMRAWKFSDASASMAEGSYVVKPGTKAMRLARRLQRGAQDPVRVTFNNVRTLADLADRVGAKMEFAPAEFIAACDSVLPSKGFKPQEYPAAFLPDTYEFYWTAPASDVVRRLSDERDKFWSSERQAKAKALGLSKVQVATLASIVEEETAKSDERGKVARLYLNRLSSGIMLQADPTVKFAAGDFGLRRISGKHLAIDSPYNTYKYAGLPPGPIRIPERSTLEKVLDAPEHTYLYMCAKEDFSGYHNFATTFNEHQANARRYHKALNARGIK